MPERLKWDEIGDREYETGTKEGALFPWDNSKKDYGKGIAWNGLTGVTETPEGAEPTDLYADDIKYLTLRSAEKLNGTITAYTYPDEFAECDGSSSVLPGMKVYQQARKTFGFVYKTAKGNDTEGYDHGYIIHILYGCTASPSERPYKTVNDSPEAVEFSWSISTTPVDPEITLADGTKLKPTALVTIDSTLFVTEDAKAKLKALEDILYGSSVADARLPKISEIATTLGWTANAAG